MRLAKKFLKKTNELLGLAQGVLENTTVSLNDVEDNDKTCEENV